MKQVIIKVILRCLLILPVFSSCKKEVDPGKIPQDPTPGPSLEFQFRLDSIPGLSNEPQANLFAMVSVFNDQNQAVINNKKLSIDHQGKFFTQKIALPAGTYQVRKFLLISGTNQVLFATPLANSPKASLVKAPLPFRQLLPQPALTIWPVEVLPVNKGDKAEEFGYPAGTFQEDNESPVELPAAKVIRLRTAIRIGTILYDSIPSSLTYRTWDSLQQLQTRIIHLPAGTQLLKLDSTAVKHELTVSKWGREYKLMLDYDTVQSGNLYLMGEDKAPKLLKTEYVYRLVNGKYVAETKTDFTYGGSNRLEKISYYKKRPDNKPYLAMVDEFRYSNNELDRISRYDEQNNPIGQTAFSYDPAGLIKAIVDNQSGVETAVSVSSFNNEQESRTEVAMAYRYSNSAITMDYYKRYVNGNLVGDNSSTSNHSTENGDYEYDQQINPYVHMGWPNLFLSNSSRNNMVLSRKTYYGNYPLVVEYGHTYKYDGEGYPVELVKKFKSYLTGEYLYTTRTVYLY